MKRSLLVIALCCMVPVLLHSRDGYSIMQYALFFDYNDTAINDTAKKALDDAIMFIKDNDTQGVYLTAYTDNIGVVKYRKTVAWKRTAIIKEYMVTEGVDDKLIRIIRSSKEEFATNNRTKEERATNRQVLIEVSYYKKKVIQEPFGLQENLLEKNYIQEKGN